MTPEEARRRFAGARVARLATISADGAPHLVPFVFAVAGDTVYSAVDAKPKRTTALKRLANIDRDPRVTLLADHYDDDWTALWWVRADARRACWSTATPRRSGDRAAGRALPAVPRPAAGGSGAGHRGPALDRLGRRASRPDAELGAQLGDLLRQLGDLALEALQPVVGRRRRLRGGAAAAGAARAPR